MKMKRTLLFLMAAACILAGCSHSLKFKVESDLASAGFPENADTVLLANEVFQTPLKAAVKDGAFVLKGKVETPQFSLLSAFGPGRKITRSLILEKGDIRFEDGYAVGTPLNDAVTALTRDLQQLAQEKKGDLEGLKKAASEKISAFVSEHKGDPSAIPALFLAERVMEPEALLDLIATTKPEVRNHGEITILKGRLNGGRP